MLAPEIEAMPRDELVARQSEQLARQVRYVYANSRFFRERMDAVGVHPFDVQGVDDLPALPTFIKDDLRDDRARTGDPFSGTLCIPASQLAFVTRSTGTSGIPSLFGLTAQEHDRAGEIFARSMFAVGFARGRRGRLSAGAEPRCHDRLEPRCRAPGSGEGVPRQQRRRHRRADLHARSRARHHRPLRVRRGSRRRGDRAPRRHAT